MEPQDAGKAPYYIVWNPWWNTTFYLSTQAKTFNLGGVKYKWYRTWHNWRKTKSRMVENLDPDLGNQQVESTANPYPTKNNFSLDLGLQGSFAQNLHYFGTNKEILKQNVDEQGRAIGTHDGFSGADYTYQIFKYSNGRQCMTATRTGQKKPYVDYNNTAMQFKGTIDKMIDYHFKVVAYGWSTAVIMVAMALASAIPVAGQLADALALALGGGYKIQDTIRVAETLVHYHTASAEATRLFNVL